MQNNKLRTVLLTALVTTLIWGIVQIIADHYVRQVVAREAAENNEGIGVTLEEAAAGLTETTPQKAQPAKTEKPAKAEVATSSAQATKSGDLAKDIVGRWEPVETAKHPIEFSQYGKMKAYKYSHQYDFVYKVSGGKLRYSNDLDLMQYETPIRIEIQVLDGETYLNIYDDPDIAGRYKKVN